MDGVPHAPESRPAAAGVPPVPKSAVPKSRGRPRKETTTAKNVVPPNELHPSFTPSATTSSELKSFEAQQKYVEELARRRSFAIRLLNKYREHYARKIQHRFAPEGGYERLQLSDLETELKTVRVLVNTLNAPTILAMGLLAIAAGVEKMSLATELPLPDFKESVAVHLAKGYFDEELQQIMVEYADYLGAGPVPRLVGKLVNIGSGVRRGVTGAAAPMPEQMDMAQEQAQYAQSAEAAAAQAAAAVDPAVQAQHAKAAAQKRTAQAAQKREAERAAKVKDPKYSDL